MSISRIIEALIENDTCINCGHIVHEDLRKWFKQKWVNIGKKDKSGKHPKCGTSGDTRGYAKCVPASKARTMSKKEKESATRRKRAAQNKAGRGGKESPGQGKKPIKVKTERNHKPNCQRKLPGESNAQWRQRCGPRPLGAISMGGPVGEDSTRSSKKGAPGTFKAKIKGPVTIAKAKAFKNRKNATPHDKAQANWFINMQRGKRKMKEDIKLSPADMDKLHKNQEVEKDGQVIKFEEAFKLFTEKNKPTNPSKWSYYKSQAKKKFDVYPSAYANAWAAKQYKAAGGGWKKESVNESIEQKKIVDLLIKYGNKIKDSKLAVKKHYKKAKKDRSGASPAQLAQYISHLAIDEGYSMRDIGLSPFFKKLSNDQRQAVSIALVMGGNMTGAVKAIEKIKKGLSKDKKVKNALRMANESIKESAPYGLGDMVKDVNPTCPHYGAMGKVTSMNPKSVVFIVKNKGENYKPGDVLEKTHDQMEKINENKGLWHNINAKKKRGEKSSPKGSKAYKAAKAAGEKLNRQKNEQAYDLWAEDGSFGYTMTGIVEAEYKGRKVKLGKPMQGDVKKFKVYVKNPKGNVVKVNFGQGGDAKGGTMKIRKSNPEARKSFRARHNCDNPGPRHKARYWSCKKW